MISVTYRDKNLHIGDTVKVRNTIVEGDKTRLQDFQGIIISFSGRAENQTIKVRHIGPLGVGVERTWPLNAVTIVDIQVIKNAKNVRRSKLYYLRNLTGRMATRV